MSTKWKRQGLYGNSGRVSHAHVHANGALVVVALMLVLLVGVAVYFSALGAFYTVFHRGYNDTRYSHNRPNNTWNSNTPALSIHGDYITGRPSQPVESPPRSIGTANIRGHRNRADAYDTPTIRDRNNDTAINDTYDIKQTATPQTHNTSCLRQPLVIMAVVSCAVLVLVILALVCVATCIRYRAGEHAVGYKPRRGVFAPDSWWRSDEGTPRIGYKPSPEESNAFLTTSNIAMGTSPRFGRTNITMTSENNNSLNLGLQPMQNRYSIPSSDESSSDSSDDGQPTVPPNSSRL